MSDNKFYTSIVKKHFPLIPNNASPTPKSKQLHFPSRSSHVLCLHAGGAIAVADHSTIFLEGTTFRENKAISLFGEENAQDSNCPIGYYYYYYYLWT